MSVFEGKRALLDAFRRGERPALSEVYSAYVDAVADLIERGFSVGTHRVSGVTDPQLARDRLQDIFIRAFSETSRLAYDGLRPFRPYLMRIAMNCLIDEARRQGRLAVLEKEVGEEAELGAVPDATPEDELEARRLREATREYCQGLEPQLQEFVRLRFEEDLSQRDVADRMGLTRRRIRTMEDQVRDGLRRHLLALDRQAAGAAPGPISAPARREG